MISTCSQILDIDDCANQPCEISATCKDGVNSYSCVCQTGFTGEKCEIGEHVQGGAIKTVHEANGNVYSCETQDISCHIFCDTLLYRC